MSKRDLKTLKDATNDILKDAVEDRRFIDGAINWADLQCVDVEEVTNMYGETYFYVYIEEAAPESVTFINYIEHKLSERGFEDVFVRTEW